MGKSIDWLEAAYHENYENELRGLRRRLAHDSTCTLNDLEGTLKNLYIMDGSDWQGRGELQSVILSATIAAYELVIHELRKKE